MTARCLRCVSAVFLLLNLGPPAGRSQAADGSSTGANIGAAAKHATGRLAGRILDVNGKPLAQAGIRLHYHDLIGHDPVGHDRIAHRWDDTWRVAKSSADGRYTFEGLPAGQFAI
jgi:hypothetical protein